MKQATRETASKIRAGYCGQYGHCNLRAHHCIRGIEAMNRICLDCKSIALLALEVKRGK